MFSKFSGDVCSVGRVGDGHDAKAGKEGAAAGFVIVNCLESLPLNTFQRRGCNLLRWLIRCGGRIGWSGTIGSAVGCNWRTSIQATKCIATKFFILGKFLHSKDIGSSDNKISRIVSVDALAFLTGSQSSKTK